ncbi:MAG TPA: septal ring lytic transglycosylase RlpA family protein [Hyphomicrobium sp.]|nr:septal ring lytic transglycosylase RlpA family protein [Hyphomicrobium sp.]
MLTAFVRSVAGRMIRRPLAAALTASLAMLAPAAAQAKTPGKTYCFNGVCHQVKTIHEMVKLVGTEEAFSTSFYDDCKRDRLNPCGLTSSGEKFRPNDADNAASPIYPNGTVLLLWNPATGEAATVRVNNSGPYWGKRKLDVSRATAEKLGFKDKGVAELIVRVADAPALAEARYKKNRRYAAVPGHMGKFASMASAHAGMMLAMANAGTLKVAAADMVAIEEDSGGDDLVTPADGLRAAARRALGLKPDIRRIAPSTLRADALYARMRQAL